MTKATRKPAAKKAAPAKKKATPKPAAKDADVLLWDPEATLGSNTDRLKNAGATWRGIRDLAVEAGIDVPWPDGGRLLRARNQFLKGTEGKPKPTGKKKPKGSPEQAALSVEDKVKQSLSKRTELPWDGDSTEDEILEALRGRSITFVSKITGNEGGARIPKETKHLRLRYGADGPYVDFASMEGPFMAISLSRIIRVS